MRQRPINHRRMLKQSVGGVTAEYGSAALLNRRPSLAQMPPDALNDWGTLTETLHVFNSVFIRAASATTHPRRPGQLDDGHRRLPLNRCLQPA